MIEENFSFSTPRNFEQSNEENSLEILFEDLNPRVDRLIERIEKTKNRENFDSNQNSIDRSMNRAKSLPAIERIAKNSINKKIRAETKLNEISEISPLEESLESISLDSNFPSIYQTQKRIGLQMNAEMLEWRLKMAKKKIKSEKK